MKTAAEILKMSKPKSVSSPTARWFEEHPEERAVMIEVIELAMSQGEALSRVIPIAQRELGGPPTQYPRIKRWYDEEVQGHAEED